jgi:hypothetical protein
MIAFTGCICTLARMNHHALPIDANGDTASALMVSGGRHSPRESRPDGLGNRIGIF